MCGCNNIDWDFILKAFAFGLIVLLIFIILREIIVKFLRRRNNDDDDPWSHQD